MEPAGKAVAPSGGSALSRNTRMRVARGAPLGEFLFFPPCYFTQLREKR